MQQRTTVHLEATSDTRYYCRLTRAKSSDVPHLDNAVFGIVVAIAIGALSKRTLYYHVDLFCVCAPFFMAARTNETRWRDERKENKKTRAEKRNLHEQRMLEKKK